MLNSPPRSRPSRRDVLRWGSVAGVATPALAACSGMSTSGASGSGVSFLTTQFTPVEETRNLRAILNRAYEPGAQLVAGDSSQLGTQVRSQADSGHVQIDVIAGLHGDFAMLGEDYLTDLSGLMTDLAGRGYSPDLLELAKLGTRRTWYVPWCQASYLICARKSALEHLPSGADVDTLTYEQYLDWAIAARKANGGKPAFGLPAGPEGLLARFVQGHLYPSFTGGVVTEFRSAKAVTMWQYLRDLWANTVPSSTNYNFMQEPLTSGEVSVAWDHVARLVEAPRKHPEEWVMAPNPAGPKGRGYMSVVLGLGIPRGAPHLDAAKDLLRALAKPTAQIDLLRKNSFFPAVKAPIPPDLPPAIRLESDALHAQQTAPRAILSLPPVGLGRHDGEMSKIFTDAFAAIVLNHQDIRRTLDAQARNMQSILDEVKVPCWSPDPVRADTNCTVG
ncbi:ABC transporter substrate-binding protein [Streptomyces sp. NPDC049954]|uniref:ABC transporter substrate-binding protein n=1 Tax=Streptomyces sp. NPDC049954 TaxID=3155779 RepID=UPI003435D660